MTCLISNFCWYLIISMRIKFSMIIFSATVRKYLLNAFAIIWLSLVKLSFTFIKDMLLTLTLLFVDSSDDAPRIVCLTFRIRYKVIHMNFFS